MDITTLSNDIFDESRKIQKSSLSDPETNLASLLESKANIKAGSSDALLAVKLDPAVLEAQVTIETGNGEHNECQKTPKKEKEDKRRLDFEKAMIMQRAALLSLSSNQFSLLMKYVDTLREQRMSLQRQMECAFCKNNGQPEAWYTAHALRDGRGRVRCPVLRAFRCPRCAATGDHAHTIKYCPMRK